MGESAAARRAEVGAVRRAIEIGYRVFDTAEMYGDGGAEGVLGQAIAEALRAGDVRRDELFVVSKVLPQNASRAGTVKACEASLKRMKTDRIDLYLLHWRGGIPFAETMAGFDDLMQAGKIRGFGVSNLDLKDLGEWLGLKNADKTLVNQVMYSIGERGIDFDLLPWCLERRIALMAYCPLAQGSVPGSAVLARIAKRHKATPAQIMLAWVMRHEHVIAIPKSARPERVRENVKAADIVLSAEDLMELDRDFPTPRKPQPLAMT
jgi:diketogulonate reductase-like aldo/keto reductase